jgi:hypothetical protein
MTLYVFVLGSHQWNHGGLEKISSNFDKLAKEIGPKGAVVMGHDGHDLSYELVDALYNNGPDGIQELIMEGDRRGGAILILNKHPSQINNNDSVLFSPIDLLEKRAGGIDKFLTELCEFSSKPNKRFVKLFKTHNTGKLGRFLSVVDLKPNIAGIGININALIENL